MVPNLMDNIRNMLNKFVNENSECDIKKESVKNNLIGELQKALEEYNLQVVEESKKFPKPSRGISTITRDGNVRVL